MLVSWRYRIKLDVQYGLYPLHCKCTEVRHGFGRPRNVFRRIRSSKSQPLFTADNPYALLETEVADEMAGPNLKELINDIQFNNQGRHRSSGKRSHRRKKSDKSDKRDDAFVLVVGLLAKSGETVGCLTGARKTFARNYAWQYSWPDTGARIQRLSR